MGLRGRAAWSPRLRADSKSVQIPNLEVRGRTESLPLEWCGCTALEVRGRKESLGVAVFWESKGSGPAPVTAVIGWLYITVRKSNKKHSEAGIRCDLRHSLRLIGARVLFRQTAVLRALL
jgi:hypothetical protein